MDRKVVIEPYAASLWEIRMIDRDEHSSYVRTYQVSSLSEMVNEIEDFLRPVESATTKTQERGDK